MPECPNCGVEGAPDDDLRDDQYYCVGRDCHVEVFNEDLVL